ncbi:MAG: choice-of-anchor L domain-containing protein [Flavobacteriales bacterium]|nr:choice-of-anchor L domain-containing protein [Flavobacteriales bacterium]
MPPLIGQFFSVGSANDVCILEFDFVPTGDSLKFSYSFGSDEYLEWVNSSFNDVFAFFLSGPGIVGDYNSPPGFPDGAINIAFVPESDPLLPITISSVNTTLNSAYYIDNVNNIDISSDGFTVTLVAEAQVICGETYHIKLAIADGSDTALESIVVLEAGSFSSNAVSIDSEIDVEDPPAFLADNSVLEGCVDGHFNLYPPANLTEPQVIEIDIAGTATNGTDYELVDETVTFNPGEVTEVQINSLPDALAEGNETITITYIFTNTCGEQDTAYAEIFIQDYQAMSLEIGEVFVCPGDNPTVNAEPDGGAPNFTYSWSSGESTEQVTFQQGDAGSYSVTVTDYCLNTVTEDFTVVEPQPFEQTMDSTDICLGTYTGGFVIGGALPYEYTYDEEVFDYSEGSGFLGTQQGDYEIQVVDQCGQQAELDVTVEECDTVLPNIFTPNKDGENDTFFIFGIDGFPGSTLIVYNRWGSVVYESENYRNQWAGDDYEDGVYFYTFARSDGKNYEGYVHLVRGGN